MKNKKSRESYSVPEGYLAHDYEKVDKWVVCEKIIEKLEDIKSFIGRVKDSLKKRLQKTRLRY